MLTKTTAARTSSCLLTFGTTNRSGETEDDGNHITVWRWKSLATILGVVHNVTSLVHIQTHILQMSLTAAGCMVQSFRTQAVPNAPGIQRDCTCTKS